MNMEILPYSLFILLGTFISAVSQAMLKKEAMKPHASRISEYLNPMVITAYGLFLLATLCSVYAYKAVPLSLGAVLAATGYLYVTLFGVKMFHERMDRKKAVALVLIISGMIVASAFENLRPSFSL